MSQNRLVRTPEELRTESKTLWYEYHQLCRAASSLRDEQVYSSGPNLHAVHNALVESFAIHCRALCCFFFPHHNGFPRLQKDDLGAEDYLPNWKSLCPIPAPVLAEAKSNADKQIAHLTAKRRDLNFAPGKEHLWAIDNVESELRKLLAVFLQHAPPALFAEEALTGLMTVLPSQPTLAAPIVSAPCMMNLTGKTQSPTDVRTFNPKAGQCGTTD
jgi:hypothetical protein